MASKNTTHLSGEFLVAGELSRRGYPVSITMGNAKSIDIYADSKDGPIKIDAKAGRTKTNWPINESAVSKDQYYIFVYLQDENKIKENVPPEYFVVSGKELLSKKKKLIAKFKVMQGVMYQSLKEDKYKERWDKLPPPSL